MGSLPSQPPQPDTTLTLSIGFKKPTVTIVEHTGPFSGYGEARDAAHDSVFSHLADKCVKKGRVDISWAPEVRQTKGAVKETTWARTHAQDQLEKDWWEILEVEVDEKTVATAGS